MKKQTLLLIAVVYLASIVIVSVLGLKAVVFDPVVPVQRIVILENSKDLTYRKEIIDGYEVITRIEVNFTTPGVIDENGVSSGTFVQLEWRVLPDNATDKHVEFIYNKEKTSVEFVKDANGNELGLILFKSKSFIDVTLRAADGSGKTTTVKIWAK